MRKLFRPDTTKLMKITDTGASTFHDRSFDSSPASFISPTHLVCDTCCSRDRNMKDYVQHKNQQIVMLPWPPQPTEHNLLRTVEPDVRSFPALSSSPAGASIRREAPPSEAENIEVRLMLDNCLISRSLISKDNYNVLSCWYLFFVIKYALAYGEIEVCYLAKTEIDLR